MTCSEAERPTFPNNQACFLRLLRLNVSFVHWNSYGSSGHDLWPVTHVTHPISLTHLTHDPLTHCHLWIQLSCSLQLLQFPNDTARRADSLYDSFGCTFTCCQWLTRVLLTGAVGVSYCNLCFTQTVLIHFIFYFLLCFMSTLSDLEQICNLSAPKTLLIKSIYDHLEITHGGHSLLPTIMSLSWTASKY